MLGDLGQWKNVSVGKNILTMKPGLLSSVPEPHGSGEQANASCPLTSTVVLCHKHAHTHKKSH